MQRPDSSDDHGATGTAQRPDRPHHSDVYVGDLYDSSVSVIDGRRCNASDISGCSRIRKVEVGSNPSAITFDQHNHTVYVPNFYDDDASVFGMPGWSGR